jgi:hypothetical protein
MKISLFFTCLVLLFLTIYCQQELRNSDTAALSGQTKDGKYDSEFPTQPVSDILNQISKSVHLLSVLAFYQSYHFDLESNIKKEDLLKIDLETTAREQLVFEQPASGTAALIYHHGNRIAFLTCAHIIDFPDTVINYYRNKMNQETDIVKSYIYKVRQTNNVINQPVAYDFKILALDRQNDIAIIGKEVIGSESYRLDGEMDKKNRPPLMPLNTPLGKAAELEFGTFVYVMGFPQAKKMVSTAIVSSPDYDNNYSFILDATLQKGISGGLVLAIRDGVPNFELVGITKAISGSSEYSLVPDRKVYYSEWEIYKPYDGKVFLQKRDLSEPGMTFAVGIETILEFLKDNETNLLESGYFLEDFFIRE